MEYRHTQATTLGIVISVPLLAFYVFVLSLASVDSAVLIATALFAVVIESVVVLFSRLTVSIEAGSVESSFGWGWPRRSIEVRDIAAIRQVRNKWYHGWGIRKVSGGWMYNVWGLDAIEIDLRTGKKFRIGTDEPTDLLAALALHTSLRPTET